MTRKSDRRSLEARGEQSENAGSAHHQMLAMRQASATTARTSARHTVSVAKSYGINSRAMPERVLLASSDAETGLRIRILKQDAAAGDTAKAKGGRRRADVFLPTPAGIALFIETSNTGLTEHARDCRSGFVSTDLFDEADVDERRGTRKKRAQETNRRSKLKKKGPR